MAVYIRLPNEEKEFYFPVSATFRDFFDGFEGYSYLVYHPDLDYSQQRGYQSLLVDVPYRPIIIEWRYEDSNRDINKFLLPYEEMKKIYLESGSYRSVVDRFNLYDFTLFLEYFECWKRIRLAISWPILPDNLSEYECDITNISRQTTVMTAEDLLYYGVIWDPVNKRDLRVHNYTLWDTFYETVSYLPDNEYLVKRLTDDCTLSQDIIGFFSSDYPFVTICDLNDFNQQTKLVGKKTFDSDPHLNVKEMDDCPWVLMRTTPTLYNEVYQKK